MTSQNNFSTRLNRRTFLRGLGVTMSLPLLEAMGTSHALKAATSAASEAPASPTRLAFIFTPNGVIQPDWRPVGTGTDFEFSKTHKPLEGFRDQLNFFSELTQDNGRAKGDGAGDHARCGASYLTGAHPVKTSGADIRVGVSIDQVAAQQLGHKTILPSLELGIEGGRNAGSCDSGYSCAYSSNIAWKTPSQPVAKETSPKLVFNRLFGMNAEQSLERDQARKSVLDFISADAKKLQAKLGQTDRRKIDEYFTSVRELEQRIDKRGKFKPELPASYVPPTEKPKDKTEHIRQMYDLMALAFQTDATRISTFMLGNAGSNRSFPTLEIKDGHHQLSHHQKDEEKISKLQKIDHYYIELFAEFLTKLNSIPEGEGTLLDNSMILYGSGLGDGNRHSHHDLPIILAGKGNGKLVTGQHLSMPKDTPMNNLFLSMLDVAGADVKGIGDSNGRVTEILK